MKENAFCLKNKIIRDKIITSNEEVNEENKNENFPFNLEYHKIINLQIDGKSKFNSELKKLIDFVKNSSHYRDLDGNRIVSKGQLTPTPYQRLEKVNQDIKDYYENKLKIRNIPLIVKNSRNRIMEDNFNVFNKSKSISKNNTKSKDYYSLKKYLKTFEKPNISKALSNSNSVKSSKDGTSNFTISSIINKFRLSPSNKSNINDSNNILLKSSENKKLLSETYNNYKTNFFKDIQLSQSNFRKPKILFPQSLTKYNNRDNFFQSQKKFSKYNNYITQYNKSSKEKMDNLLFKIDRDDIYNILNKNKKTFYLNNKTNKSMTKVKNITKEINNRDIVQFNIDQLFKQDKKYENKLVLNTMPSKGNFINLKMEKNKKINVKVYDINSFGFNNMTFKSFSERINNDKIIQKQKTYKSFDSHKSKKDFSH